MSVNPSFRAFALEQLGRTTPAIRARNMFGGVGIYAADLFFALLHDDTLYFKVDDTTRKQYQAHGMEPFRPYGDQGEVMQYYQVPEEVLEDPEVLRSWVEAAVTVARNAKRERSRRRRASP
jgi:DNA transformation protein